jgi:hypothetical protein
MPPPASLIALLTAGGLLTGCSSFRTEWGRPLRADAQHFAEGRTRVETVIQALGPPARVSALPGGFVFLYEHSRVSEFQIGVSVDAPVLRWIKFVHASNGLDRDIHLMVFDEHGVLRSMDPEAWREKLGGGNAAQLLFAVMSLTDDSALRQRLPPHDWGRTDLQSLPVLLNMQQSLRSGQHGLQQRLAPTYAGQHTLEMAKPKPKKKRHRGQSSLR